MASQSLLHLMGYLEIATCLAALCFITVKRQWREYWALGSFLAVRAVADSTLLILYSFYRQNHHAAYVAYFYIYWAAFAIQSVLVLFLVCSIYRLTMKPLEGLRRFGSIVFCAVSGISIIATLGGHSPRIGRSRDFLLLQSPTCSGARVCSRFACCWLSFVRCDLWESRVAARSLALVSVWEYWR